MAKQKPVDLPPVEAAPETTATLGDFYPQLPPQKPKAVYDLVAEFYDALCNHPDAQVLGSDFGTRPTASVAYHDTPREGQRIVMLRFLMRWPHKG